MYWIWAYYLSYLAYTLQIFALNQWPPGEDDGYVRCQSGTCLPWSNEYVCQKSNPKFLLLAPALFGYCSLASPPLRLLWRRMSKPQKSDSRPLLSFAYRCILITHTR